ncbi:hypothetical protein CEXT_660461 [Caerostris extrusa]|uniref:Reverse transcriptase Ty1/copia-type domain-containing protein n=1 Tax=Caerostris extrusa TaxID=172846 RepID=A0AAV4R554_CAEEX|nr:hypothetical protein CEXT_660461 [Caerostris extrusa]
MADEIQVMNDRQAWKLMSASKNSKVIGCRWVYTLKKDEKDVICRCKARVENLELTCCSDSDFASNRESLDRRE